MPKRPTGIPGGGLGKSSVYLFKTDEGYKAVYKAAPKATSLLFAKRTDMDDLDPISAQILGTGATGTSVFDPVLCELAYRWFSPPGGLVIDPFAGGSVRGVVASRLGRQYLGVELRQEQLDANELQRAAICGEPQPRWVLGDATELQSCLPDDAHADMLFSCPPYGDLERYSDDERDLSTMEWPDFVAAHKRAVEQAAERLKQDRFAVWVVGDFRNQKTGLYRRFPELVAEQFAAAGVAKYNEMILVTAVGSLPVRVGLQFTKYRKVGKSHQNVLVFVKGDPRAAVEAIGEVEAGPVEDVDAAMAGFEVEQIDEPETELETVIERAG